MQWEEVQINIELTLNVSEKTEKATTENLESSLGWSDFPKRHAVIRPSGKSSCAASARLHPALHNTRGELLSILRVNLQHVGISNLKRHFYLGFLSFIYV